MPANFARSNRRARGNTWHSWGEAQSHFSYPTRGKLNVTVGNAIVQGPEKTEVISKMAHPSVLLIIYIPEIIPVSTILIRFHAADVLSIYSHEGGVVCSVGEGFDYSYLEGFYRCEELRGNFGEIYAVF